MEPSLEPTSPPARVGLQIASSSPPGTPPPAGAAEGSSTGETPSALRLAPQPTPRLPKARPTERVTVDGKFFRAGRTKFYPKGVTYGPFAPNSEGDFFASPSHTRKDFELIARLGANLLRVYYVPPRWFLDLALEFDLRVLVDVPWNKHLCFLDETASRDAARQSVRSAARACSNHPTVFALSVVNEIPSDIVRWSGDTEVADFIDELVKVVKAEDPGLLCTFGNFPPTEFLHPECIDFFCFNIYLHDRRPYENYLARLQMLANTKPLILGEVGIDSLREGLACQGEILHWKIESAFRAGLAGIVVYSFTDDWYKEQRQVSDWAFGLTTQDRTPKPAFEIVQKQYAVAPYFPLAVTPRVSVVIATYNGAATLKTCLDSLLLLNYPDYEILLVDDGSTDSTQAIAGQYPTLQNLRHPKNQGLSAARNTGIAAATGEIVAFTDSDCRADEDWLYYLIGDLVASRFTGMGGHNFLPPDDSPTAACVMASPGGPAHVMLNDRLAEHIPGCNMAFYRWALQLIGGFDPVYRKAGDDVDICWRLQQRGFRIGFNSAGFVWHYRRNTVQAYLRQQVGYGEAEAMLERRHPENFSGFGGSRWSGRIYTHAKIGIETRRPIIYHGVFGSGFFQSLYTPNPGLTLLVVTSLEYHVLVTLPLLVLGSVLPYVGTLGIASLLFSLGTCVVASGQAQLPQSKLRGWSRPLVALLFFLQPIVRGWARHRNHLLGQQAPLSARESLASLALAGQVGDLSQLLYWSEHGVDRMAFLGRVLNRLDEYGWQNKPDSGWNRYDVEITGSRWARLELMTATEFHSGGRQLLRCRLRAAWSFLSRALFLTITSTLLLIIGALGKWWLWSLLLLLVPLAAWLSAERHKLRRLIVHFLDERAREFGLVRVER